MKVLNETLVNCNLIPVDRLKSYHFTTDNIKVLNTKGKSSSYIKSNQHMHTYWEIKVFSKGDGKSKLPLIMIIPPNIIHESSKQLFLDKSNFALGLMEPRIILQLSNEEHSCLFSQVDDLSPGGVITILRKIQKLQSDNNNKEILTKLLNDLINLLFSAINIALNNVLDIDVTFTLVERACDYIERQYYKGELTIEKISIYLGVSPGHLANLFKKESLCTVRQYLIKTRLKHGIKLLKTGRYTVKDVTKLTGWNNQFYFSSCFKKHYKISPSKVPIT